MRFILVFILMLPILTFSQERYFDESFQTSIDEESQYLRVYNFKGKQVLVKDYNNDELVRKVIIHGLSSLNQVDSYITYCKTYIKDLYYRNYFEEINAICYFYRDGNLRKLLIANGADVKVAQIWNIDKEELLSNGCGQYVDSYESVNEELHEVYIDSVCRMSYIIRIDENDTIYITADKMATPKNGFQHFYNDLREKVKYPSLAKYAGKECRIYIEFIVDKTGNMTDITALSDVGYRFEKKTVKKLENFVEWYPATIRDKAVKSRFKIPIKFSLID